MRNPAYGFRWLPKSKYTRFNFQSCSMYFIVYLIRFIFKCCRDGVGQPSRQNALTNVCVAFVWGRGFSRKPSWDATVANTQTVQPHTRPSNFEQSRQPSFDIDQSSNFLSSFRFCASFASVRYSVQPCTARITLESPPSEAFGFPNQVAWN